MKTRYKPTKIFNTTKVTKARWLLLLVFLLLFALVATTSAQEDTDSYPDGPPVPDPIFEVRTVTPQSANIQATFFTSQDAYLSSGNPNTNYDNRSYLRIGYRGDRQQAVRMLFQFNLSQIPKNSIVHSATISFWQTHSSPSTDAPMGFKAQYMKTEWCEKFTSSCYPRLPVVTWNNAGYLGGTEIRIGEITNTAGWKSGDVTNIVREWVSQSQPNYGVILTGDESVPPNNRSRTFYSRETAGFEPRLTVIYDQTCDNLAPTAWVENLPQYSQDSFIVRWTGTDSAPPVCTPVGIAHYDVQYSINGGSYTNWQENNTGTSNVQAWGDPTAFTTVDTVHPEASVLPLDQYTFGPNFEVKWDGQDNPGGSDIANYGVQFKEGDGGWQTWLTATTAKSAFFTGAKDGVLYEFKARATDNVGNVQPWPDDAQASTIYVNHPVALVDRFDPVILEPTNPVTDSFKVSWTGVAIPEMPITGYNVQVRFNNGPWVRWLSNVDRTDDIYPIPPGNPDGTYYFEAAALSTAGTDGLNGNVEAFKIVDLEPPFISVQQYLPIILINND
jgi:hypothetical protein